jgi:hypothetical protein
MEEIYISRLELQRWYLEFVISISKTYLGIWEKDLVNSFGDHVTQISYTVEWWILSIYILQVWKVKLFLGNLYSSKSNTYIFLSNSYACPMWIFIIDTDQAQIYTE